MIILDTNIFSELMRTPAPRVIAWLETVPPAELVTTAITRAEIVYGIERLPAGRRRTDLRQRAAELFDEVADRTWAFDAGAADRYGELVVAREQSGRPISVLDAQIASIAHVRRAQLATRNVTDFDLCGIVVVDPFAHS